MRISDWSSDVCSSDLSGEAMPAAVADAAGSRFELLLPFGCSGPSEAGTSLPMQWRYDEADGTLRVSVKPMMWSEADWNLDDRASTAAAEGFWITRPWSSSGACPLRGIGRASCRERVCQYVEIWVVAGS